MDVKVGFMTNLLLKIRFLNNWIKKINLSSLNYYLFYVSGI